MKEVVKAADYQRVDSLFVAKGHQQWGSFDPHKSTVQLHEQKQAVDKDFLDFAAIHNL
jgi:predicted metal-dependent hydrolase